VLLRLLIACSVPNLLPVCTLLPLHPLSHYSSYDSCALRNWDFEGYSPSLDTWVCLRSHKGDTALAKQSASNTWPLDPAEGAPYTKFRIQATGMQSDGTWFIACSGFEIFGLLHGEGGASAGPAAASGPISLASLMSDVSKQYSTWAKREVLAHLADAPTNWLSLSATDLSMSGRPLDKSRAAYASVSEVNLFLNQIMFLILRALRSPDVVWSFAFATLNFICVGWS
jgi:hypothetical protein